jgi:hypothetical protein
VYDHLLQLLKFRDVVLLQLSDFQVFLPKQSCIYLVLLSQPVDVLRLRYHLFISPFVDS